MIGKQIALIQVPNKALFSLKAAAQYLGISAKTLREHTGEGRIDCYDFRGRRTYKWEDLERLREELRKWQNPARQTPISAAS